MVYCTRKWLAKKIECARTPERRANEKSTCWPLNTQTHHYSWVRIKCFQRKCTKQGTDGTSFDRWLQFFSIIEHNGFFLCSHHLFACLLHWFDFGSGFWLTHFHSLAYTHPIVITEMCHVFLQAFDIECKIDQKNRICFLRRDEMIEEKKKC